MNFKKLYTGIKRISRINPSILTGMALIAILIFSAVFAGIITAYSPYKVNINNVTSKPNLTHFFGTDDLGRDLFSRVVYGSRISLLVGIVRLLYHY